MPGSRALVGNGTTPNYSFRFEGEEKADDKPFRDYSDMKAAYRDPAFLCLGRREKSGETKKIMIHAIISENEGQISLFAPEGETRR